ncbi:MAG: DUF1353 domain-containing protein [Verrucomicrobiaceae bacterium]|nr:MAG: DUF1353 domain-containing protein [Verrucomicrobiaceae bacterium]
MPRFLHLLLPCILVLGCVPGQPAMRDSYHGSEAPTSKVFLKQQGKPEVPALKRLKNGRYRVTKPWTVHLDGKYWHIQKGYTTNGITAPARFKAALGDGVDHPETWAAVYHDWLFTQDGISREEADRLFYKAMLAYGVPASKARLMYTTVRAYTLGKKLR